MGRRGFGHRRGRRIHLGEQAPGLVIGHLARVCRGLLDDVNGSEGRAKAPAQFRIAAKVFADFSPSCRREYIDWIAEAKREETRLSRAEHGKAKELCVRLYPELFTARAS